MNAITQNEMQETNATLPVSSTRTRPFYWSVRRELWEHRSLWMAPLVAAGLILLSFIVSSFQLPGGSQMLARIDAAQLRETATGFYGAVGVVIALTMIVVTWFYCLDALFSERRDRSILFWKSLPVSDVTTVTSKLFVASAVAPSISFAIVVATQLVILLIGTAVILFAGGSPGALWSPMPLLQMTLVMLYGVLVQAIWFAPFLAWLIFVSAWARRSPALWAGLVPAAVCLFERIAFGTTYLVSVLNGRLAEGLMHAAFAVPALPVEPIAGGDDFSLHFGMPTRLFQSIDIVQFLSTTEVWVGLAIAAAFTAATVWMRRYREPL